MSCNCIRSEGDTIECGPCCAARLLRNEGAMQERKAVVDYLRGLHPSRGLFDQLADSIEKAEHTDVRVGRALSPKPTQEPR
jgi:hypothetical protein